MGLSAEPKRFERNRELEVLHAVFVAKEGRLLGQLGAAMADKSLDTFDTWMKQQSDLVQATAHAYGDREVLEASLRSLDQVAYIWLPWHLSRLKLLLWQNMVLQPTQPCYSSLQMLSLRLA